MCSYDLLAGGKLVAEQILQDYGCEIPWREEVGTIRDERLDAIERPVWLGPWEQWVLVILVAVLVPWLYLFTVRSR